MLALKCLVIHQMNNLIYLTLFFDILYGGLLLGYFLTWRNHSTSTISKWESVTLWPTVSIIIPVRNEEKNIPNLFRYLAAINYPSDKLEIIFVDDHSDDNTLQQLALKKHFSLTNTYGKKAALDFGIRQSNAEWIVTIDADIHFKSDWLKLLIHPSINTDAKMICGLVQIEFDNKKWWSKFQAMEFANLQASGFAALMQKRILLNSGANLAFRKEAWLNVGAYNSHHHLASGDDTFLMFEINKLFPGTVLPAFDAIVSTSPEKNFHDLLMQRLRWSSKTIYYNESYVWFVGILITISSILTTVSWITSCFLFPMGIVFPFVFLAIRAIPEWLLLIESLKGSEVKFSFIDRLMMSIIYPFFIITLVLIQPFSKNTWKGRQL